MSRIIIVFACWVHVLHGRRVQHQLGHQIEHTQSTQHAEEQVIAGARHSTRKAETIVQVDSEGLRSLVDRFTSLLLAFTPSFGVTPVKSSLQASPSLAPSRSSQQSRFVQRKRLATAVNMGVGTVSGNASHSQERESWYGAIRRHILWLVMVVAIGIGKAIQVAINRKAAASRNSLLNFRGGGLINHEVEPVFAQFVETAPEKTAPVEKFRKDYKQPNYWIREVQLDVKIFDGETSVESLLTCELNENVASQGAELVLDGEDLKLVSLEMIIDDGSPMVLKEGEDYKLTEDGMVVTAIGDASSFKLRSVVTIEPEKNTQLSGLYCSDGMYCTQMEAEGFRRFTYFPDRPDVMAKYTKVRIEADQSKCPVLLGNGNKLEEGACADDESRHYAVFEDPFAKPSYLFAIVAGNLGHIEDTFTTASGRCVKLAVFSEKENVHKLDHAMTSLKKAMRWDEERFGLEYDLDVYNIVSVNDFNMGAMENKGLNIFNASLTLASPKTATDDDYERIESVIGHEYFHNWTGNRVTCRDWFQLTLKEGLTVFRDQEFSADMGSPAVKRIQDVLLVKGAQFPEDESPIAHPIRPESYISMDNFYTSTVYMKGAEVIRMYQTILGRDGFRKGMDLYFERHDGNAVSCDDFRNAMADANGRDLTQFEEWYLQSGTPQIVLTGTWDAAKGSYALEIKQKLGAGQESPEEKRRKNPLHIPVVVGLLDKSTGKEVVPSTVLELTEEKQTFTFDGLESEPILSALRGFSAPVEMETAGSTNEDLAFLAANDTDSFNRWEALQTLYSNVIKDRFKEDSESPCALPQCLVDAFRRVLNDRETTDTALIAYALVPPGAGNLRVGDFCDPMRLHEARVEVMKALAAEFREDLEKRYAELTPADDEKLIIDGPNAGRRQLRNTCLKFLALLKDEASIALCATHFAKASASECMTDKVAALGCLANVPDTPESKQAMQAFYDDADGDALVLNKWFMAQASASVDDILPRVQKLMEHPDFSFTNPNRLRSVVSVFAGNNYKGFHKEDGSGYAFLKDMVLKVDKLNPQVASRLATSFKLWPTFDAKRQDLAKEQLKILMEHKDELSKDTFETVSALNNAVSKITNVAQAPSEYYRSEAKKVLSDVQAHFVEQLESVSADGVSSKGDFAPSEWQRGKDGSQGGGKRFGVVETPIFNRASVNYSSVAYDNDLEKPVKSATALSVIIHPRNPHAPSMHCHFSYTEPRNRPGYWRMISDLNPSFYEPHAKNKFESALEKYCPKDIYDDGKLFGDKYFFIPELNMYRGTHHLFFPELSNAKMDPNDLRQLAKSLATATIDTYTEIVQDSMDRRPTSTVTAQDVAQQLAYHTAYFYQVLFLDCGTTAGIMAHSDNDVGTLASLPSYIDRNLLASWLQDRVLPPHDVLLRRILEILPTGDGPCKVTDDIRQKLANTVREYYNEDRTRTKSQADMDVEWWASRHGQSASEVRTSDEDLGTSYQRAAKALQGEDKSSPDSWKIAPCLRTVFAGTSKRTEAQTVLSEVQAHFVARLEAVTADGVSSEGVFAPSEWQRGENGSQGGGKRFGVVETPIFNRASVNYSAVYYDDYPEKPVKSATALSVIIHPRNPHAPSMHCHFSYTEPRDKPGYWRMISDLNPSLREPHAKNKFETALKQHCPQEVYDDGKLFGDKYFFIPELNMYRGTHHLFFPKLVDGIFDPQRLCDLAKTLATTTIDTYTEIIQDAMNEYPTSAVTEQEAAQQLAYHTAYFYQVLFLDCGTTAGIMAHSDNDVGTLASLPSYINRELLASWLRDRVQAPHDVLLRRILDVLPSEDGPCKVTDDIRQKLANTVREYYTEDRARTKFQADMDMEWWASRHEDLTEAPESPVQLSVSQA